MKGVGVQSQELALLPLQIQAHAESAKPHGPMRMLLDRYKVLTPLFAYVGNGLRLT